MRWTQYNYHKNIIFRCFIHGHRDMGVHRLCIVRTALLGKQAFQAHYFVPKLGYALGKVVECNHCFFRYPAVNDG